MPDAAGARVGRARRAVRDAAGVPRLVAHCRRGSRAHTRHRDDGLGAARARRPRRARRLRLLSRQVHAAVEAGGLRAAVRGRAGRARHRARSGHGHHRVAHPLGSRRRRSICFRRRACGSSARNTSITSTTNGGVLDRAIDPDVATMLHAIKRRRPDASSSTATTRRSCPGVRVYTGGKHTFASQFVGVATRSGTVVLASDNAYLYENLERKVRHRADARRRVQPGRAGPHARPWPAASPDIVPGHDPAVFDRFPLVKPGVARID